MDRIEELNEIINKYDNIVFFGGAGVSTESGIPDFRSVDGLYNQKYDYPPETILSHSFYVRNRKEFYRFYKDKMPVIRNSLSLRKPESLKQLSPRISTDFIRRREAGKFLNFMDRP